MFQEAKRENEADTCSLVTPFYLMFQVFISLVAKAVHKLTDHRHVFSKRESCNGVPQKNHCYHSELGRVP